jgi:hypothetical protein
LAFAVVDTPARFDALDEFGPLLHHIGDYALSGWT